MKARHVLVGLAVALPLSAALLPLAAVFLISIAVLLIPIVPIAGITVVVVLFVSATRTKELATAHVHTPPSSKPVCAT
jgi:hypothetical protein